LKTVLLKQTSRKWMVSPRQKDRTGLIALCTATNCQANKGTLAGSVCIQKHFKCMRYLELQWLESRPKMQVSCYFLVRIVCSYCHTCWCFLDLALNWHLFLPAEIIITIYYSKFSFEKMPWKCLAAPQNSFITQINHVRPNWVICAC